jgi:hypothetical protein
MRWELARWTMAAMASGEGSEEGPPPSAARAADDDDGEERDGESDDGGEEHDGESDDDDGEERDEESDDGGEERDGESDDGGDAATDEETTGAAAAHPAAAGVTHAPLYSIPSTFSNSTEILAYESQIIRSWREWLEFRWLSDLDRPAATSLGSRHAAYTLDVLTRLRIRRESMGESGDVFAHGDRRMAGALAIMAGALRFEVLRASGVAWMELGWDAAAGTDPRLMESRDQALVWRRDVLLDALAERCFYRVVANTCGLATADLFDRRSFAQAWAETTAGGAAAAAGGAARSSRRPAALEVARSVVPAEAMPNLERALQLFPQELINF